MEREPSGSNERGEDAPQEKSMAEREYDTAAEFVDRRMDQGIDSTVAWGEIDPTGKIRRDFQQQQDDEQDALNHTANDAIRQAAHDREVAKIEQIYDPAKRAAAMRELLAVERAQASRRGRRY